MLLLLCQDERRFFSLVVKKIICTKFSPKPLRELFGFSHRNTFHFSDIFGIVMLSNKAHTDEK